MTGLFSRQLSKAAAFGFVIGISGAIFFVVLPGHGWEEQIGLSLLFKLRGTRQPPSEVLIVSIDRACAEKLHLPSDPERWPRALHARLTDILVRGGASMIVFDIFFRDARSAEEDALFAEAMRNAGNVVIVAFISRENVVLEEDDGTEAGEVQIEELVQPLPIFSQSAAAVSPFPLPKVPVKVSQYWTFKTTAGEMPTLPVTAFQVFASDVFDDFIRLLRKYHSSGDAPLSLHIDGSTRLVETVRDVREMVRRNPEVLRRALEEIDHAGSLSSSPERTRLLRSLVRMYESPDSQYLNFYGAPHTIRTISYDEVLSRGDAAPDNGGWPDLRGKAVFVGSSASSQPEQKDGFYTVFSDLTGLDISGVEIAATAFANLWEDMPVRPLPVSLQLLIILAFGVLAGLVCRLCAVAVYSVALMGAALLYFGYAFSQFKTAGTWFPLVTPLLLQLPAAFLGGLAFRYRELNRERRHIKEAFKFYLPDNVVEEIAKKYARVISDTRTVYGTCLYTDAEGYTGLSEKMEPEELSRLMNRYYDTVFSPVKKHGGLVSNVIGDAMLAVWVTAEDRPASRTKACLAALDIQEAVSRSSSLAEIPMKTRIGVHSGRISLGSVGAADHYEYRPVGDIVNTATRIEGLNKLLGTGALMSEDALRDIDGFLTRRLGTFLLAGKSHPVVIHELLCRAEEADETEKALCTAFSAAYEEFKRHSWEEASRKFREILQTHGEDGPSRFYADQCDEFKVNPPGRDWEGVIRVDKK